MTLFQVIVIPVFSILLARSLALVVLWRRPLMNLAATALWSTGIFFVCSPDHLSRVANWLGVGRGSDLLLYLVAVGSAFAFLHLKHHNWKMEQDMTTLIRSLAIQNADHVRDD